MWAICETFYYNYFIFLSRLILFFFLYDRVWVFDWAVIKRIFSTHQLLSLVAQRSPTSHPFFSISLVYTPFFWRSCCLALPVSSNCPSYSLDFRPLVPHQWQPRANHIAAAVFCLVASQGTLKFRSNLLGQRQGFEIGIKDCVLTKKERVSLSLCSKTTVGISVCFLSREKKSCTSSWKLHTSIADLVTCFIFFLCQRVCLRLAVSFSLSEWWYLPDILAGKKLPIFLMHNIASVFDCRLGSGCKATHRCEDNHSCWVIPVCSWSQMWSVVTWS